MLKLIKGVNRGAKPTIKSKTATVEFWWGSVKVDGRSHAKYLIQLTPTQREKLASRAPLKVVAWLGTAGSTRWGGVFRGYKRQPAPPYYWIYEGRLYSCDVALSPEDVVALVHEDENRVRLRLAKAHSLMAMTKQLDSKAKRQPIPQEVKVLVWQRDGGRCVECGSQENLEYDHVIPLSMGGSNTDRNLQLLCEVCNRRKGATLG